MTALRIILYVIAGLLAVGAIGFAGLALSITHRRQQRRMIATAFAAVLLAAVLILAAGGAL